MSQVMRAVAVLAAVLVASVGGGAPAGARPAQTRQCGHADLAATYRSADAAMGHRYGRIVLRNVSSTPCRTGGYGGLSYVGHGDGTQVGAAATRDAGRVRSVVLHPGERVRSAVAEAVAANYPKKRCRPVPVDGFRVYVPDETKASFVRHRTTGCANARVHLLSHGPYRRP